MYSRGSAPMHHYYFLKFLMSSGALGWYDQYRDALLLDCFIAFSAILAKISRNCFFITYSSFLFKSIDTIIKNAVANNDHEIENATSSDI